MDDHRRGRFGRYEILDELGRGAMGVVYKARDPKINRVVAVKTVSLSGQPPEDEIEFRERFFREAEAAGRLSHPGIVTIFDVGEEPETRVPYIVMEFVGGSSLEKLLCGDNRKLPLETALQLTLELAEALDCAHGQGVVHRDLKPSNILVTEDGRAKIADFGVAKLNLAHLTLPERAFGTPAYMSPEQLSGEAVDGRSDLFSLGVILYTLLTGYRPFQGSSALTVSFKVANREPIPATILDTNLPPGVDYIITRAMAKNPLQRYQRGMEMVLDLQELREGREPWSKTKQPGSFAGYDAAQTTGARASSRAGYRAMAAMPHLSKRAAVERVLERMRKHSFASAVLLIGALLVIGTGLAYAVWAHELPFKTLVGTRPFKTQPDDGTPSLAAPGITRASTSAPHASPAILDIEVEHKFAEAHLSVWVDDRLFYAHVLEGTDRKHLGVFHNIQGHEFHAMKMAPGKHRLRVRVETDADSHDRWGTVAGEFGSGKENLLRISFNKHGDMNLNLQ